MYFVTDGVVFKAVKITGPTHNYLGLTFSSEPIAEIKIEALVLDEVEPAQLDSKEVCKWVKFGVEQANNDLFASYHVKEIQFVQSDSPPVEIYAELAKKIVERMHAGIASFNK